MRGEEPHPTRGTTVLAKHAGSRPEKVDKKSSFDEVSSLSKMKQPDAQSTTVKLRNRTAQTRTTPANPKDTIRKRNKKKREWRKSNIRCACWNILSWNGREHEILTEMEEHKIDICALSEIKQKGNGEILYPGYLLKYSGKEKHERATAGVGILIKEKYIQSIEDTQYINERILRVSQHGRGETTSY